MNFLSIIPATEPESRIGKRLDSRFRGNDKAGKISDFIKTLPKYYQITETNFEIKNEKWAEEKMAEAEKLYGKNAVSIKKEDGLLIEFDDWWFSLRVSNSEYLLRLNMEATSKNLLDEKFGELKKFLDG